MSQCLDHGVVFKRAVLSHISEAFSQHHGTAETNGVQKAPAEADLVVNCTGLGALTLKGVEDKSMMPARGQITLVRNEAPNMVSISGCDDAEDETCYVMQRAAGGGTILGGSYQKGNWDGTVDEAMAERIMKRAVELCPGLVKDGPLDVVRHGVGLRPLRQGGTRLELETMSDGTKVVHNYGHGGYGCKSNDTRPFETAGWLTDTSQIKHPMAVPRRCFSTSIRLSCRLRQPLSCQSDGPST